MIIKLRFYKENDRWYADVPDHTQEENEMVFGSDTFLDLISNGKSEITFTISDEKNRSWIQLYMKDHDEFGATYKTHSSKSELCDLELWICNVTHTVFGEHPERIYILKYE